MLLELILCIYLVFDSWKIEAFNYLILPLLLVPEWAYWPPNSKDHFTKEINAILHKMLNLWFRNFRPIFLRKVLFWLLHFFCIYGYLFELIFAFLAFGDKAVVLAGAFLWSKIMWYPQNFQWVQNSFFPNRRHSFSNSLINYWNLNKLMEYLIMLCLKCGLPCVNSPSYFQ